MFTANPALDLILFLLGTALVFVLLHKILKSWQRPSLVELFGQKCDRAIRVERAGMSASIVGITFFVIKIIYSVAKNDQISLVADIYVLLFAVVFFAVCFYRSCRKELKILKAIKRFDKKKRNHVPSE